MRSLLFVPGDSERKIEKAASSGADVLIYDLEDSVAPDRKAPARRIVRDALDNRENGKDVTPLIYVRVNALDSGLAEDDLAAVAPGAPDGIVQPKTTSGEDVLALSTMLDLLQDGAGMAESAIQIIAIATGTAASMFNLGTYPRAGPRLAGMAWGAEDLSADLGAATNRGDDGSHTEPYWLARTLCLLGAVAAGCEPIDTVHTNFHNTDGLRAEAEAAARDGFTAKLAIHPAQVPVINEVFTPSAAAVEKAQRIVQAFAKAGDAGVIGLDGEMLDRPHLTRAEKLLARAKLYGA